MPCRSRVLFAVKNEFLFALFVLFGLSTYTTRARGQETCQDICLPLLDLMGNMVTLWVFPFHMTCGHFQNPGVVLARVHLPGQYLVKACLKSGLRWW